VKAKNIGYKKQTIQKPGSISTHCKWESDAQNIKKKHVEKSMVEKIGPIKR
jgi:hypothetical protein